MARHSYLHVSDLKMRDVRQNLHNRLLLGIHWVLCNVQYHLHALLNTTLHELYIKRHNSPEGETPVKEAVEQARVSSTRSNTTRVVVIWCSGVEHNPWLPSASFRSVCYHCSTTKESDRSGTNCSSLLLRVDLDPTVVKLPSACQF